MHRSRSRHTPYSKETRNKILSTGGIIKEKRICKNHLFSLWLPEYEQCIQGNKRGEACEELKE